MVRAVIVALGAAVPALVLVAGVAAPAAAQSYDPAVELQLYEPALGPRPFLSVAGGEVLARGRFGVGAFVTYLANPLRVRSGSAPDDIDQERTNVVESVAATTLMATYGIGPRLHVGLAFPVVLSMSGQGLDPATAQPMAGGLQATGLGDARLELAFGLVDKPGARAAAILGATLPTSTGSDDGAWLGDDLPTLRPRLAVDVGAGRARLALNMGVIVRQHHEVYNINLGSQVTYGGALAYAVSPRAEVLLGLFGRSGFSGGLETTPVEMDGGVRLGATRSWQVVAGGGAGVVAGVGAPDFRLFVQVDWSPDYRDSDGDGLANLRDRCPFKAEDKDSYQDADGCPEPDNDGDFVDDADDKCPLEAEDKDGVQDDDGCVETDGDGDGVIDEHDHCQGIAEDGRPPRTEDGCPLARSDYDDDGLNDAVDRCPEEAEDPDGVDDQDGCPEQ